MLVTTAGRPYQTPRRAAAVVAGCFEVVRQVHGQVSRARRARTGGAQSEH